MAKAGQKQNNKELISAKIYKGKSIDIPEKSGSTLGIVTRGEGTLFCGRRGLPIKTGDTIILIDRFGEIEAAGEGIEIQAVDFMKHLIGEELGAALTEIGPVFRGEAHCDRIADAIEAIHKELRGKHKFGIQASSGRLLTVATEIARSENEYESKDEISAQVATAIAHITEHYQEKISLTELSAVAGVSPAYLSRRFTQEMGMGYADYLSLFRLRKAEKMLREEPDKTVTEVAFFCGFNDSNYFSDKFKKHFGAAPLRYRKTAK